MPTDWSKARAVSLASLLSMDRWCTRDSVIWLPTFMTGLSEVIGSWNTMAISDPQMDRISFWEWLMTSVPS